MRLGLDMRLGLIMGLGLLVRLVLIGWRGLVAMGFGESHASGVICLLGWRNRLVVLERLDISLVMRRLEGGEHIVGLGLLELGVRLVGRWAICLRRRVELGIGLLRGREKRSFLRQLWHRRIARELRRLYDGVIWLLKGRLGRLLVRGRKRAPGAQRATTRALFTITLAFLGCAFAFP